MRKIFVLLLLAIVVFGFSGKVLAEPPSDNVIYAALSSTTQDIQQGGSGEFKFSASSPYLPQKSKEGGSYYDLGCVWADFIAKDLQFTDSVTTSNLDFSSWFTFNPPQWCYAGPREVKEVAVSVTIPANAAIGTYTAKLVAKGPQGIGWGEAAGVHIIINVLQAVACDSTAPNVSFTKPGDNEDFILGKRVEVHFTAIDLESPIIAWDLVLNSVSVTLAGEVITTIPNGIDVYGYILTGLSGPPITKIGSYTLTAYATSDGGDGIEGTCPDVEGTEVRHFDVNYDISPIAPQLPTPSLICSKDLANLPKSPKPKCAGVAGGDLQIKFDVKAFQPHDTDTTISGTEVFVRDETVSVEIVNNSAPSTILFGRIYTGSGPDSAVQIGADQYFTKLSSATWTGWDSGSYTINVYFNDYKNEPFLQYQKSFTIQD